MDETQDVVRAVFSKQLEKGEPREVYAAPRVGQCVFRTLSAGVGRLWFVGAMRDRSEDQSSGWVVTPPPDATAPPV